MLDFRWFAVSSIAFFRRLFLKAFLEGFLVILGGFGRPKRRPKSTSGTFFFDAFFECVLVSLLGRFLEARNLKNSNFASTGARFLQNRRFRKNSENAWMLVPFSEAETKKNQEKHVLKNMRFFNIDFLALCSILLGFWEAPDPQKIEKNQKKTIF